MKEVLLNAFRACALRYCKNDPSVFGRFSHLWDELHTTEQKITALAQELEAEGYQLVKVNPAKK